MAAAKGWSRMLVAAAVMMCLLAAAAPRAAGITCGDVASGIGPCIPYLRGTGTVPSPACCNGVSTLNGKARTTPDRQTACNCLKTLAGRISGIDLGRAAGIPSQCRVNVGFPISLSTDCSKVH